MKARKVMAGFLAGLMAMSLAAFPAMAAPTTTKALIDKNQAGSITLYKIVDENGNQVYGNGLEQSGSQKNALDASAPDLIEGAAGVKGVQFKALKLANIVDVAYTDADVRTGVDNALTKDGKSHIGTFFEITDAGFVNKAQQAGYTLQPAVVKGGKNYYTTAQMETALQTINGTMGETTLNKYIDTHASAKSFSVTDTNGKATLAIPAADQGLYLVGETDITNAEINGQSMYVSNGDAEKQAKRTNLLQLASPFLISVPMTNVAKIGDDEPGTVWQYDITAYPKNASTEITKKIISDKQKDSAAGDDAGAANMLIDTNDYKMGATVRQMIFTDVPVNRQNLEGGMGATAAGGVNPSASTQNKILNKQFIVTDYMSKGLTFKDIEKVAFGAKLATTEKESDFNNLTVLTRGPIAASNATIDSMLAMSGDYVIVPNVGYSVPADSWDNNDRYNAVPQAAEINGFSIVLTSAGLAKLDTLTQEGTLAVIFDSTLNKDAVIGTDKAADEYNEQNGGNTNHPTLVYQHTNSKIYSVEGNQPKVFTYELDLKKLGLTDSTKATFVVEETAASRGVERTTNPITYVEFTKEADGVYHVYDASKDDTIDWRTLAHTKGTTVTELNPKSDGSLVIKGLDSEQYTITEIATQTQYQLLKSELDVYLKAANPESTNLTGALVAADTKAIIDGSETLLTDNPATGKVKLSIENLPVLKLRTGGEGNRMLIFMGIAAALCAGVLAFVYKKRRA